MIPTIICGAYYFKLYKSNKETVSPFKNCSNHTNLIPISNGNTVQLYLNGYGKQACLQLFSTISEVSTGVNQDLFKIGNDAHVWLW